MVPGSIPVYVPVRSESDANVDDCFINVAHKVERDGGTLLHGWQIWEWISVMIEAEFHAIWVSPIGEHIDITPKKESEERVLFLPDPTRAWNGKFIDNVRQPIVMTQLFKDLDAISKRLVILYNNAERVPEGILVDPKTIGPMEELKQVLGRLLNEGGNLDSRCTCASGRKYKNCHRKILYP